MNAIPVWPLSGMAEKKASNAANPPAEAPMPTMGKPGGAAGSVGVISPIATAEAGSWGTGGEAGSPVDRCLR
ncbi:MAG: hypothetical protein WDA75_18725, partial [Candidatus Latescibacterota bacterium]